MRTPTPSIAAFVQSQFPDFYHREGGKFVSFVQAYYEWLAEENNVGDLTSRIYNLRDIDLTIDDFVDYFKNKYLNNFQTTPDTDVRRMVKHAVELFGSKGTEQSIKLLFQLLYGQEVEIYHPGNDILRADDGKWFRPKYIEVSPSTKIKEFLFKTITGASSGATAYVESVIRKTIHGRVVDIVYLSNIRGLFEAGERITADGNLTDCPVVFGSMIDITIENGGANNAVGDILTLSDGSGIGGKVRVTNVESATGRVTFTLVDGGYGYRLNSGVFVSEVVFDLADTPNTTIQEGDIVSQLVQNVSYISGSGSIATFGTLRGANSSNGTVATGKVMSSNATVITVNLANGNFASAATIDIGNTFAAVPSAVSNLHANGTVMEYTAANKRVALGTVLNDFYANGTVSFATANITANIATLYTGEGADFNIGSLTNEENVFLFTDFISSYANVALNATSFGFPKLPSGNISSILNNCLASNSYTIGEISAISGINPGDDYNVNPAVRVYDPLTYIFKRYPFIVQTSNVNGGFIAGESVTQTNLADTYTCALANVNGTFANGEGVTQNTGAKGTITLVNSTSMTISSLAGIAFSSGNTVIFGSSSGANAMATTNVLSQSNTTARGTVIESNSSSVTIQPKSFNTTIGTGRTIVGSTSGANALVTSISEDVARKPMGYNANVTANVTSSNGVASQVVVIDSGFGWRNNETVTLTNADNPFIMTGVITSDQNGTGEGFWKNNDGKLDSDKFLQDNYYYQEYSYEIQTGVSLEIYRDMLKKSFHIAGTELFGRVVRVSETEPSLDVISEIET